MPTLTITFHSDWRVGTGTGLPGDLDDLVRRDDDGLPMVPGRTLTGMLRDGCEQAATALGGTWPAWVDVLLGEQRPAGDAQASHTAPRPAALSIRAARLPEGLRAALAADPRTADALFAPRTGVAIDDHTGQVRPDFLRRVEVTRGGLVLDAPYALDDTGWNVEQRRTALVLLALGAAEVSAIGADRRRGLGRCTVALPDDAGVAAVLAAPDPPDPAAIPPTPEPVAPDSGADPAAGWVDLELTVVCVDPLVSTTVATDGTVHGRASVPGARLLPAVIARARAAGIELEPLTTSGLVVEPLRPEVAGHAGRVAPRCLTAPKGQITPTTLWNVLRAPAPSGETPKPLRHQWIAATPRGPVLARPALTVQVHNTVHDPVQRPTTDVGGLFSVEAIPAGSRLRGRVRVRTDDGERFAAALTGRWELGRARKSEYGRVDVVANRVDAATPEPDGGEQATVWFVEDAVLLDDRLAPVDTVPGVVAALSRAAGVELEALAHAVGFERVEAWQRRWGRPRPTLFTVAAGSTLLVRRRDRAPLAGALRTLAIDGIGERRAEGFGRLSIDDPLLAEAVLTPTEPAAAQPAPAVPAASLDAASAGVLAELHTTARHRLVEERAAGLTRASWGGLAGLPRSQRANLRAALTLTADPVAGARAFLAALRTARVRDRRWSATAEAELRRLLDTDRVWVLLDLPPDAALHGFALRRVLAHLGAGGRAADPDGNDDGA